MTENKTLFKDKMEVEEFGAELIRTGDLDPVYIIVYMADLVRTHQASWLLAYWWFYHAGVACELSQYRGEEFYLHALKMATGGAPRGTERRHFRGQACIDSIKWFKAVYEDPITVLDELEGAQTFTAMKEVVEGWPMFGPWIAFKVADMMERIVGVPVHFNSKDVFEFYDQPREAVQLVLKEKPELEDEIGVVAYLTKWYQGFMAPPRNDRAINIQEIETILCKWKSHCNRNYPIGKDTKEIRHHLKGYGPLAGRMLGLLP